MHSIVITGAESTGKSTLTDALAQHYQAPHSKEFVRQYVDGLQRALTVDDLESIARGQLRVEDSIRNTESVLVLHDTNLLSSILYAEHYFDASLDWVNRAFAKRDYSLYLLCMPDIPWVADDGQRESPAVRAKLHRCFKARLDQAALPYVEIHGCASTRLDLAIQAIDTCLAN